MQNSEAIWSLVEAKREEFFALADRVWETPELNYQEVQSSAEHATMIEHQGFRLTRTGGGLPTAVIGEAGERGPVIVILGEC
jgi:aminobenzoyl-glutamate utilization protein B